MAFPGSSLAQSEGVDFVTKGDLEKEQAAIRRQNAIINKLTSAGVKAEQSLHEVDETLAFDSVDDLGFESDGGGDCATAASGWVKVRSSSASPQVFFNGGDIEDQQSETESLSSMSATLSHCSDSSN